MVPLKFIHAADLHLDSPFSGLSSLKPELATVFQEATFEAYDSLIELALRERADFLLVAGDIYDGADRSLRAQLRFRKGLERLAAANIPAYVVHGNHDPLDGWSSRLGWPEAVTVFPGDGVRKAVYRKDGREAAVIQGVSYPTREIKENLALQFSRKDSDIFYIGLLHCNLGANTGHAPYAPCTVKDLEKAGLDYWALGHVHTRAVHPLGDKALAVYPGNTQGRHPGESGERGAMLVTVDSGGGTEARFIATDRMRWESAALDLAGLSAVDDLLCALESLISGLVDKTGGCRLVLRISLEGRSALHSALNRSGELEGILSELRERQGSGMPQVWIDRLEDRTRPLIDLEKRRRSDPFLVGLLDEFETLLTGLSSSREEILSGLGELYGNPRVRKNLSEPDESRLRELIERARTICVDRLAGAGEGEA